MALFPQFIGFVKPINLNRLILELDRQIFQLGYYLVLEFGPLAHLLFELSYLESSNAQLLLGVFTLMELLRQLSTQSHLILMQLAVFFLQTAYQFVLHAYLPPHNIIVALLLIQLSALLFNNVFQRLNLWQ